MRNCSLFLFAIIVFTAISSPANAVTDEQVGKTIENMKKALYAKQNADGSFEPGGEMAGHIAKNRGGHTALATLALLVSGESMQNPKIQKALKFLRRVDMEGTYAISLRNHVWSYLPDMYNGYLAKDTTWLIETARMHKKGLYSYTQGYTAGFDHSNTQYGMLGMWQGSKRGANVPENIWQTIRDHFIAAQNQDGGWGYRTGGEGNHGASKESMTGAGLTALLVAQQELYRNNKTANKEIQVAINKGLGWMDKRFAGGQGWYSSYGIERVALASGTRFFNKRDWYQAGAEKAIRVGGGGGGHGGAIVNTCFALMFLSRGRVPVWINKLEVSGQIWNNRPNDLYFLTEYLSNLREGEVNWQVVSMDYRPDDWLMAPVAYLSSTEDLKFTDAQKANLKQYLDRGGMLVCNPEGTYFKQSIRALVESLYPQYKMRPLGPSHPIFHTLHQIDGRKHKIHGLSNGARELVLMFDSDVGFTWQSDRKQVGPLWDLGSNLFALATNKGVLANRLVPPFESRKKRQVAGEIVVGRAKYDGNWLPEPASWKLLGNPMFNKTGVNIKTADVELSAIGSFDQKLIHLAGTDTYKLKNAEREAIKQYAANGGTLLVETVGGLGDFARDVEKQLAGVFKNPPVPLGSSDAVISGEGLAGGFDCSRVSWRWRTVQTMAVGSRPRLAAILIDGRPAVIISHEDLSLGMMGLRHWHVMGYSQRSARELATNVLLASAK